MEIKVSCQKIDEFEDWYKLVSVFIGRPDIKQLHIEATFYEDND